jgi:hypothetical protein
LNTTERIPDGLFDMASGKVDSGGEGREGGRGIAGEVCMGWYGLRKEREEGFSGYS